MAKQKRVEIYSAGCSACTETIQMVKRIAGQHELIIHDMNKPEAAAKAKEHGIHRVPAVVIDGKLAECCKARAPEENVLRAALA